MEGDKRTAELEADLRELCAMLELSKRPSVQEELRRVQAKLEQQLKDVQAQGRTSKWQALGGSSAEEAPATVSSPPAAVIAEELAATPLRELVEKPPPTPVAAPPPPAKVDVKAAGPWTEITTYDQNLGGYDKPHVTVDVRLKGIEALPKENITCDFTESSFDLKIIGLDGQNYRFLRTNLDKDIAPRDSEVKVKKNHVIVQLSKVKGQYGFDSWTDLVAKGKRKPTAKEGKEADPQASIMGMMQDLYNDGDDSMKKIIGEAMYKSRSGEKYDPKDLPKPEAEMDM